MKLSKNNVKFPVTLCCPKIISNTKDSIQTVKIPEGIDKVLGRKLKN